MLALMDLFHYSLNVIIFSVDFFTVVVTDSLHFPTFVFCVINLLKKRHNTQLRKVTMDLTD